MLQPAWDPPEQHSAYGQFPNSSSSGQGNESFQGPQPEWDPNYMPQPLMQQQDFFASIDGFSPPAYQVLDV